MILSENTTLTGNGIGTLTDAVSAIVTHEINGQYELMVTYPVTGINYSELAQNRIIWAEPDNMTAQQAFRIYRITRPLNGIVTVYARHLAYDMSGIIVEPHTASTLQAALSGLPSHCVPSCPFTFTTARAVASPMKVSAPTALWSLLGGQAGSFLDVYGGEWAFDNFAATLTSHLGSDRGVSVRYGKNLTELEQDLTIEATYVGIYPFWYEVETDTLVTLPEKYISTTGTGSRILILDCSGDFENQPTVAQLRTRAESYITANSIGEPQISWKVSFAQLAQDPQYASIAALEQVQLGDTIHVFYEPMELEASSRAVKIEYDVLMKRYRSVTLGRVKQNLAAIVAGTSQEIQKAVSASRTAIDRAIENSTDFIKNGTGYMRFIYNDAGDLMEIVSLDNPDINQAQKVWRWNNGGFGFSSTGYNGPYTTAITQDGSIVADFITTGTLNAARIKAGILEDEAGKFSLNMVTGELHTEQLDVVAEKLSNIGGRNYAWAVSEEYHPDLFRAQNCTYTYNPENNGEYVLTSLNGSAFPQIWHRGSSTTGYPVPDELKGTKVTWHCDYISASGADPSPRAYIGFRKNNADQYILSLNPERLSYTFTVPSDCEQMYVLLRVRQDGTNINGETMTVRGLKLERGEVATDWTPAPEDAIAYTETAKAEIKVTTDAIESSVTAETTRATGAESSLSTRVTQNATNISSKVSNKDYNGQTIASLINQSADTVQIEAQHINLTGAVTISSLSTALASQVNGALSGSVTCYYRSTTSSTPAKPTAAVISTAANTSGAWTLVMPRPLRGCYFWECVQYTASDGTVTWSTVRQMANATYTSLWCSSSDQSYIDGGKIYANSVTASQIDVDDLFAQNIIASNMNITGGSVVIDAGSNQTTSYVKITGNYGTTGITGTGIQGEDENGNMTISINSHAGNIFLSHLLQIGDVNGGEDTVFTMGDASGNDFITAYSQNHEVRIAGSSNTIVINPDNYLYYYSSSAFLRIDPGTIQFTDGTYNRVNITQSGITLRNASGAFASSFSGGSLSLGSSAVSGLLSVTDGTKTYSLGAANGLFMYAGSNKYSALIWPDSNGAGRLVLGDGTSTKWRTELTNSGLVFRNASDSVTAQYSASGPVSTTVTASSATLSLGTTKAIFVRKHNNVINVQLNLQIGTASTFTTGTFFTIGNIGYTIHSKGANTFVPNQQGTSACLVNINESGDVSLYRYAGSAAWTDNSWVRANLTAFEA